jgi:flagellar protein FliS
MTLMTTELTYRKSAIGGASAIGLMIALFDTLAGDLRRAATALRKNDIETRCKELNHGTLVLGQLESWVDLQNGGDSAQTLSRFYAYLRAMMMEAAISKSAKLLETQIDMLLHVRSAWQQLDAPPPQGVAMPVEGRTESEKTSSAVTYDQKAERIPFSQSA